MEGQRVLAACIWRQGPLPAYVMIGTMPDIDPDEAQKRFGSLQHTTSKTYRHFDDPEDGIWRPLFHGGKLLGHRLYRLPRVGRKVIWRPK